ncbi:MAG: radical SAM protein [Novosphingobium sp.]|nr:radical SAM protein [Novosphingobium sp.]
MINELKINPDGKIGLDITYACNLKCMNCNRLCNCFPRPKSMLTINDVNQFVSDSEELKKKWQEVTVVGGEPTLHPDFEVIMEILLKYTRKNNIKLVVLTNGYPVTSPVLQKLVDNNPEIVVANTFKSPNVHPSHIPMTIAPVDINFYYEDNNPCDVPVRCGMGMNKNGYFACNSAASIDDVLQLGLGVKCLNDLNEKNLRENAKKICKYCGYYLSEMGLTCQGNFDYQIFSPFWKEKIRE